MGRDCGATPGSRAADAPRAAAGPRGGRGGGSGFGDGAGGALTGHHCTAHSELGARPPLAQRTRKYAEVIGGGFGSVGKFNDLSVSGCFVQSFVVLKRRVHY